MRSTGRIGIGLLLLAFGAPASAQRIVGEIADPGTGMPVSGAFIRLLDADGGFLRGVLSDSAGRFGIPVPGPGRYRIAAERIGYTSIDAGPFDVAADSVVVVRLESGSRAIALDGIEVDGEKRCSVRPERAAGAARVWDEARKALEITRWAEQNAEIRFRVSVYSRALGPRLDTIDQTVRSVTNVGGKSFPTAAPALIEQHGFARLDGDTIEYAGLDAGMLLSDWFLDSHCFELVADADQGMLGLTFRPLDDGRRPDVTGTLWVDRASGELRSIEYVYIRVESVLPALARVERSSDPQVPQVRMSAQTRFSRLDNGVWIVSDWWIRVPELRWTSDRVLLNGWRERGGVVLEAWDGKRNTLRAVGRTGV